MTDRQKYFRKPPDKHSQIKSEIVVKYFKAWSSIISRHSEKLAYIDLYAGPGLHDSGNQGTALQVIEYANTVSSLRKYLKINLNDKEEKYYDSLRRLIDTNGYSSKFKQPINVSNFEVNELTPEKLRGLASEQKFCFIDPYGFRGITRDLIKLVIADWGCDCIIFFNTSIINRQLENQDYLNDFHLLFGEERFETLLETVRNNQTHREEEVISQFRSTCLNLGIKYFLPFGINKPKSKRLKHHIIFLSKHPLGFGIIKSIMKEYSLLEDGIPQYIFSEGTERTPNQLNLPICSKMEELKILLLGDFACQEIRVKNIVEACHKKVLLYTTENIKEALKQLKNDNKIEVVTNKGKQPRSNTMGDKCNVTFPNRE